MRWKIFIYCLLLVGNSFGQSFVIENGDTIYNDARYVDSTVSLGAIFNCKYPSEAIRLNAQGTVYVEVDIDKNGNVKRTKILKDPYPDEKHDKENTILDKSAEDCLKANLHLKPISVKGRTVNFRLALPIKFQLPKE